MSMLWPICGVVKMDAFVGPGLWIKLPVIGHKDLTWT